MSAGKPFRLGVVVGRFQMPHIGHTGMIRTALSICDRTAVFIGSSQESGTEKNPFSYEEREELLRLIFGDVPEIWPLPDLGVGNNPVWGEYVLDNVIRRCSDLPDLFVSGQETRRADWLGEERRDRIAELYVPKVVPVSASRMRGLLLEGNRAEWERYTEPVLWDRFDLLRSRVLAARGVSRTESL